MSEIKLEVLHARESNPYAGEILLITREQCDLVVKALKVALARVEDPMAGQGDLYTAALDIFLKGN